jgi:hypothetical protein
MQDSHFPQLKESMDEEGDEEYYDDDDDLESDSDVV